MERAEIRDEPAEISQNFCLSSAYQHPRYVAQPHAAGTGIQFDTASSDNHARRRDYPLSRSHTISGLPSSNGDHRNFSTGSSGTHFQHLLSVGSDGTPPAHHGAVYPTDGAAGTSYPFSRNTDVAISINSSPSPTDPTRNNVISLEEILDFFKGNLERARDTQTWFTPLLGINGGVIFALTSMSSRDNPQSLSTKILVSFASICAVVGFLASLAGMYQRTYEPEKLPFGFYPVYEQNLGKGGGVATAWGIVAIVLLLFPNDLLRWIIMGLASAAFTIPVLAKCWRSLFLSQCWEKLCSNK